jgi:hypothetical protein
MSPAKALAYKWVCVSMSAMIGKIRFRLQISVAVTDLPHLVPDHVRSFEG